MVSTHALFVSFILLSLSRCAVSPATENLENQNDNEETDFVCQTQQSYPSTVCRSTTCTNAIVAHIKHEFDAAFKYMQMGAIFGQYNVALPGTSKFLMDSAIEERSHAIQMLDYLNTRGVQYNEEYEHTRNEVFGSTDDICVENALTKAIAMEIEVTEKIHDVIKICKDDYHAGDVFTNPILDEQHHGLRKLQGALKALKDIKGSGSDESKKVAEYFFDLKLLKGEIM